MARSLKLSLCVLLLCGSGFAWAQGGFIPIPRVPIPHVPISPQFFLPLRAAAQAAPQQTTPPSDGTPIAVISLGAAVFAVLVIAFVLWAWASERRRPRLTSFIRVIATPLGEAPEEVRAAWVGVRLPLAQEGVWPLVTPTQGIATQRWVGMWQGYRVNGREAVNCLAESSPAAAAWWRRNAPHVLEGGYQLVFPVEVCECTRDGYKPLAAAAGPNSPDFVCRPDGTVEDLRQSKYVFLSETQTR